MSKHGGTKTDWPIMLLLFAGLPVAFAYGGKGKQLHCQLVEVAEKDTRGSSPSSSPLAMETA